MPGRDYNKAYALFEQSLGDTSYPVYPKAEPNDYRWQSSYNVRSRSFAERTRLAHHSISRPERPCVETHLLPPTPPPGTQSQDPSFGLANRMTTPELTPDTRHGTPFTNLEAPTPNTTPPSLRSHPTPQPFKAGNRDSSRAESFRTAQEDVSPTSEVDSPIELPLQGVKKPDPSPTSRIEVYALGLQNFDRVTEMAHRRLFAEPDLKRPSKEDIEVLSSVGNSPKSESRLKRRKLDNVPRELTFLEDAGHTSLKSPTNQESPSSWLDGSSTGENSPVDQKQSESELSQAGRFGTPESKILAPSSTGSPVVEASIVDSPPHHPRQLRHVSKNAELRLSPPSNERKTPDTSAEVSKDHGTRHNARAASQETSYANNKPPRIDLSPSQVGADRDPVLRTRSLLTSKMPKSLRAKQHSWRRSAPGLMVWDSSGNLSRNPMGVVPEDSPLPESPQPPSDVGLGESKVPSQRRSSERSTVPSEALKQAADQYLDPNSGRNTFTRTSPVSDASEALVGDATTVSIYPHNNDSLLVVEHPGSSSNSQAASKETHSVQQSEADQGKSDGEDIDITPEKNASRNPAAVESPLTNPRRPPEPPPVSITSSNPDCPEDNTATAPASSQLGPLEQHSFSQRAKRYSDSLTLSMSRFRSGNGGAVRRASKRTSLPHGALPQPPVSVPATSNASQPSHSLSSTQKPSDLMQGLNSMEKGETHATGTRTATTEDSAGEGSATENIPPGSGSLNQNKQSRRLSVRRILSLRSSRKGQEDDDSPSTSPHRLAPLTEQPQASESGLLNDLRSQRRGLAGSLRQRLRERSIKREEQRHHERQEKLRHSIGPRFYVEHGGLNGH